MVAKKGFQKKTVILLVVIAVILATLSITLRAIDSSEMVSTESNTENQVDGGKVGVTILPPEVEDKGTDEAGVPNEA